MNALHPTRGWFIGWISAAALAATGFCSAGSTPFQVNPLSRGSSSTNSWPQFQTTVASGTKAATVSRLGAWLKTRAPASTTPVSAIQGLPGKPSSSTWLGLAQLRANAGNEVQVRLRPGTGTPSEIKGAILGHRLGGLLPFAVASQDEIARRFLSSNRLLLRLEDPEQEVELVELFIDQLGRTHYRYEQQYRGLEVWPGEFSVHTDPFGNVDLFNGAYTPTPLGVATDPQTTGAEAILQVRAALNVTGTAVSTAPELIIYGPLDGEPRLAWIFDLSISVDEIRRCVVDALSGDTLLAVGLVCHAAETGSGTDSLGQTRNLNLWKDDTTYVLVDTSKPMYDATSSPPNLDNTRGAIVILDALNTPPTGDPQQVDQLVQSTSNSADSGWVPDAISAAFGLSQTYDYYLQTHERSSLDGNGVTIVGIVRFGINFPNAFWNGKAMFFGDNFTRAIDVTGHELTHGVINNTGDGGILVYHNQPGALNESLADIFGEMVEEFSFGQPDWLKGDELDGDPIQNYANPNALSQGGIVNPARMSQFAELPDTPQGDNGGVHINSSIINHAYYLLAAGLPDAIGTSDASRIFYRTMTTHLQKESQFIDMRHGCLTAAEELFGQDTPQVAATATAFDTVEIFDAPPPTTPPTIPVVQGDDATLFLAYLYDDFWGTVDGPYLVRRDPALGDSTAGTVMNTWAYPAQSRVSVTGDGTFAVFVTDDLDLGVIETADAEGVTAEFLGAPGSIGAVTMSPDGSRYAFVLLDEFGALTSQITVYDAISDTAQSLDLYVPLMDGERLDIVQFADAMAFLPDGQTLVYDAYSEFRIQDGGAVGSWTLFAIDVVTGNIQMLINLSEGLDFGNPSLGHAHPYLLTFEVIDKATGLSEVYTSNLQTGDSHLIRAVGSVGDLGYPSYNGDDTAIIYTVPDQNTWTGYSLARQAVAPDGITPVGEPTLWQEDGGIGVVYRRGDYVSANNPPTVALSSPEAGQTLTPPATITLNATANDSDGPITKVEFFNGSTLLNSDNAAPYAYVWNNVLTGEYRLSARVTDSLGAAVDSSIISVTVAASAVPPEIVSPRRRVTGELEFQVQGQAGQSFAVQASTDLQNWTRIAGIVLTQDPVVFVDPAPTTQARRYYRLSAE